MQMTTTLMAESKEKVKSLLKLKEKSEEVGLKLNIQKAKIMAYGSISSWQINGETMEIVGNFIFWTSLVAQMVKRLSTTRETQVRSLVGKIPWKREWQPSPFAWRIPWTEEPGGLKSMRLQRVGHDQVTNTQTYNVPSIG